MQDLLRPDLEARRVAEALARCRRFLFARWRGHRLVLLAAREHAGGLTALVSWHEAARAAESAGELARLSAVLDEVQAGQPRSALGVALAPVVRSLGLSLVRLRGPLAELERGSHGRSFATRKELAAHARRIAAPEARLLLELFGRADERDQVRAEALAVGLRVVGWLGRLPADVARGRLHVAVEELIEHRLDIPSLAGALSDPRDERARALLRDQVDWARAELAKGWPLCDALGPWRGRVLALLLRWHAATLSAIEARGYHVPVRGVPAGWLRALACGAAAARGTGSPVG